MGKGREGGLDSGPFYASHGDGGLNAKRWCSEPMTFGPLTHESDEAARMGGASRREVFEGLEGGSANDTA